MPEQDDLTNDIPFTVVTPKATKKDRRSSCLAALIIIAFPTICVLMSAALLLFGLVRTSDHQGPS